MAGRDGGCTISGVQIDGDRMRLGHVGDTRAYLRAGGEVRQLTQDHSFVAAMVASGIMAAAALILATGSAGIGVVTERWLFFAEANHPQNLYYQRAG